MGLANLVSLSRIPLSLGGSYAVTIGAYGASLVLFVLVMISDLLDGLIAKRMGPTLLGAKIDFGSDLFSELVFFLSLLLVEAIPLYVATAVFLRITLQVIFISRSNPLITNGSLTLKVQKRKRVSTVLTWSTLFFVLLSLVVKEGARPLYDGLTLVAFPYIYFPLCFSMELLSISLLFQELMGKPVNK